MKKILIFIIVILFINEGVLAQQVKYMSNNEFEEIEFTTQQIENYPKNKIPSGINNVYIRIIDNGQKAQLIFKLNDKYKLLPSEKAGFYYNFSKKLDVEYKNGLIYVSSIMPYSSNSSTGIFKITSKNKLIFVREESYSPNSEIYKKAEAALKQEDIKTAADLYIGITYPPLNFYENTQKKLLIRAHELAFQQFKAKEYKKAAETMGYAYDFFDIEDEIYLSKKMLNILADYSYFLDNAKMYEKCINVSLPLTQLESPLFGPFLHLGDSYYHTNQKQKALKAYNTYCKIRKEKGQETKIPSYVKKRIAELYAK